MPVPAATQNNAVAAFAPRAGLVAPELSWLLGLSEAEYREHFRGSPVKRAKWRGLLRNACIAAGNALRKERQQAAQLRALLARLASSDDAVIAEHARWALAQSAPSSSVPHAPSVDARRPGERGEGERAQDKRGPVVRGPRED